MKKKIVVDQIIRKRGRPRLNDKKKKNEENEFKTKDSKKTVRRKSKRFKSVKEDFDDNEGKLIKENDSDKKEDDEEEKNEIIENMNLKFLKDTESFESTPIFTGFPIESFPNNKIKKVCLWPQKNGNKRTQEGDNNDIIDNEKRDLELNDIEHEYRKGLLTTMSDKLISVSNTRTSLKTIENNNSFFEKTNPVNEVMKNIKLKTTKNYYLNKTKLENLIIKSNKNKDKIRNFKNENENEDFCSACGGVGVFICCDTCVKSFHFLCCDPPLETTPESDWNCRKCSKVCNASLIDKWKCVEIFDRLLRQQDTLNPVEFHLPHNLRNNTFVGITTGPNGEYQDDSVRTDVYACKNYDQNYENYAHYKYWDIEKLYDKNGNPHFCFKCGKSGLNNKILLNCDYCPLLWHIDCLFDPVYTGKSVNTKWKCPNHFELIFSNTKLNTRRLNDLIVIDTLFYKNHLKFSAEKNVIIKHTDQPYIKSGKNPTLKEYLQYESDDFSRPNKNFQYHNISMLNESYLSNFFKSHEKSDYKIPDFLDPNLTYNDNTDKKKTLNFNSSHTVVNNNNSYSDCSVNSESIMPIFHDKISTPNSININENRTFFDNNIPDKTSITYRIPEKLIILDFITTFVDQKFYVKQKHSSSTDYHKKEIEHKPLINEEKTITNNNDIFKNGGECLKIQEKNLKNQNETLTNEIESITGLLMINFQKKNVNFLELVSAASVMQKTDFSKTKSNEKLNLEEKDIKELLEIRDLIKIKGKEMLIKFLQS